MMFPGRITNLIAGRNIRRLTTGSMMYSSHGLHMNSSRPESERMKQFREKLKTKAPHDFSRLNDPVLIDIDPDSGEFIPESEKEPTKWGDWQHGGRVSDF